MLYPLKKTALAALFTFSFLATANAQFTVKVCDAKPATEPLKQTAYLSAVQRLTDTEPPWQPTVPLKKARKRKKEKELPPAAPAPVRSLVGHGQGPDSLVQTWMHPVLYAASAAYAYHHPLVLSPDMVWLMISQGFAQHVDLNAEKLRPYLVDFQGKQHINVSDGELPPNWKWDDAFPIFSEKIGRYVGPELVGALDAKFSTSTPATQAAFRVTLMDAVSEYFNFSMTVLYGIPEVTLEGSPEDWALLEEKTKTLAQYELAWWTDDLAPTLRQLTETSKGNPDLKFWNEMYKVREEDVVCSQIEYINGWMLTFFPYINGERNPYIGGAKPDFDVKPEGLGDGYSKVDFLLDNNGSMHKMQFMAGFVGLSQHPKTLALRPEINWGVVDTGEPPTEEMLKSYRDFQKSRAQPEARN
jgi:hypothetical protein